MDGLASGPPGPRVDDYYERVAPWLDQALDGRGDATFWRRLVTRVRPHRIVELGCGTGRVTRLLHGPARTVVGLDRSPAMLRRARRALADLPGVHLVQGDLRFPPLAPRADLIAAPDDPLIHLEREEDRQQAIRALHDLLAPGGRAVLDFLWWTPDERRRARSSRGLVREHGEETSDGRILRVREQWRLASDDRTLRGVYAYRDASGEALTARFQGRRWTPEELRRRATAAGLEVLVLRGGYGGEPFDPATARALVAELRRPLSDRAPEVPADPWAEPRARPPTEP